MTAESLRRVRGLALERFFGELGGRAEHLLCTSDVEPYRLPELLALADPDTLQLWDELQLGYTDPGGIPALRAEIAALYAGVEPDEIVTCAGADEAIFLALNALLRPGDHAVVTWPAYQSLHEVAYAAGAEVTFVPLDPADGWALDVESLRRAIRPTTRAVIVNFRTTRRALSPTARPSRPSRHSRPRSVRISSPTRCTATSSTILRRACPQPSSSAVARSASA